MGPSVASLVPASSPINKPKPNPAAEVFGKEESVGNRLDYTLPCHHHAAFGYWCYCQMHCVQGYWYFASISNSGVFTWILAFFSSISNSIIYWDTGICSY